MAPSSEFVPLLQSEDEKRDYICNAYLRSVRMAQEEYGYNFQRLFEAIKFILQHPKNTNSLENGQVDHLDTYIAGLFLIEPVLTEAIFSHMNNFIKRRDVVFNGDRRLRIVCLSDGTGFETLGILRAFCEFERFVGRPQTLDITVSWKKINWQCFFTRAYSSVQNYRRSTLFAEYLNQIPMNYRFFEADVEDHYGKSQQGLTIDTRVREQLDEYVKNADLVIMGRISAYSPSVDISSIVEGVGRSMTVGAFLYLGEQESLLPNTTGDYVKTNFLEVTNDSETVTICPSVEVEGICTAIGLQNYLSTILLKTGEEMS